MLEITMTALLLMVAVYTILGGMLSVLVTDFLQFIVMSIGLVAVTYLVLFRIGWEALAQTVNERLGPQGFNPFLNPDLGVGLRPLQRLLEPGRRAHLADHDPAGAWRPRTRRPARRSTRGRPSSSCAAS